MARRHRRGSQSLELALTLPLWLGLVIGVADTCWILHQRATFGSAVEAGCRDGALRDPGAADADLPAIETAVNTRTLSFLDRVDHTPCPTCAVDVATTGSAPSRTLVCTGTRTATALTSRWFGTFDLTARRSARLQRQRGVTP